MAGFGTWVQRRIVRGRIFLFVATLTQLVIFVELPVVMTRSIRERTVLDRLTPALRPGP